MTYAFRALKASLKGTFTANIIASGVTRVALYPPTTYHHGPIDGACWTTTSIEPDPVPITQLLPKVELGRTEDPVAR